MIIKSSIDDFLTELASKSATPGGGSAAAIMGAIGAALVQMVCNLTIGKPKYEAVEQEFQDLLNRAKELQQELIEAVEADVTAFNQVMTAYSLPKESEPERVERMAAIQLALRSASSAPLKCASLCREVIYLCEPASVGGNRNVISDAGVAVAAAHAALKSAALNVYVNVNAIDDETFKIRCINQIEEVLATSEPVVQRVFDNVRQNL